MAKPKADVRKLSVKRDSFVNSAKCASCAAKCAADAAKCAAQAAKCAADAVKCAAAVKCAVNRK